MVGYRCRTGSDTSENRHRRAIIHYFKDSGSQKEHGSGADGGMAFHFMRHLRYLYSEVFIFAGIGVPKIKRRLRKQFRWMGSTGTK